VSFAVDLRRLNACVPVDVSCTIGTGDSARCTGRGFAENARLVTTLAASGGVGSNGRFKPPVTAPFKIVLRRAKHPARTLRVKLNMLGKKLLRQRNQLEVLVRVKGA